MATRLRRTAAFAALGRALTAGARGGPSLGRRIRALPRMIRASARREYDGGVRVAAMAAAAAYIASPIDLVPEGLLLLFGIADDLVMASWLAGAVLSETERFLAWEQRKQLVGDGPAVSGRRRR